MTRLTCSSSSVDSHGHRCPGLIRRTSPLIFAAVMLSSILLFPFAGRAADPIAIDMDYPLGVINVASFQRLRDNAQVMFEAAERPDMVDRVDQWIVNTLKETKGIDRSKPFGMMIYLHPEIFRPPLFIPYLPVTNLDEALDTLAYGIGTVSPVEGQPNRFNIQMDENIKIRVLHKHGYLFVVFPDGNDASLDRDFPDPEKLTARMSSQHDISVSFMIKSIPPALKTVMLTYFKTQSQADLQQRDDEPDSVYRLRRANGEVWIELIDRIANQGNEITLGGRLDKERKVTSIDLEAVGTRDSKFAKFFQTMAGKRTYFGNLLANPSTFTMSSSILFEEKQRKLFVTYFEAAQKDLAAKVDEEDAADLQKIITPIFKTLMATAEAGHLDAFAQLTGVEPGEFALIAAVKLSTSREFPPRIEELLEFLKDGASDNDLLMKLDLGVDTIDSHPVHRLPINPPEEGGQRLFGETASLYIYANTQAIWCAFGGDEALHSLKAAVQSVASPQDPKQGRNRVPFQFVTHARNWLSVADDDKAGAFLDRAESSFDSDNDALTIELRPTDTGLRIRAELQSGFIGLLGRNITNGIETGIFTRPPRQRGENSKDQKNRPDDSDLEDLQN